MSHFSELFVDLGPAKTCTISRVNEFVDFQCITSTEFVDFQCITSTTCQRALKCIVTVRG